MGFISLIVAVATIGGFMFGYDSGVINGTQEGLESAFGLSKLGTGFTVGAILIGCAAGAASSATLFVCARLLGGLGVGAASVLSPVYISEVTPAHIRGRLSSVQQ